MRWLASRLPISTIVGLFMGCGWDILIYQCWPYLPTPLYVPMTLAYDDKCYKCLRLSPSSFWRCKGLNPKDIYREAIVSAIRPGNWPAATTEGRPQHQSGGLPHWTARKQISLHPCTVVSKVDITFRGKVHFLRFEARNASTLCDTSFGEETNRKKTFWSRYWRSYGRSWIFHLRLTTNFVAFIGTQ